MACRTAFVRGNGSGSLRHVRRAATPGPCHGSRCRRTPPAPEPEAITLTSQEQLPQPTDLQRRVGEGGWLVELLLPRTDAGVLFQAVVVGVLFLLLLRPARRADLLQLWVGSAVLMVGLFALRGAH